MGSPPHSGRVLRFGRFELDPETQQLRKAGVVLRLQPQPFKVLMVLVVRAGQIVSREELRRELWGSETFVDFEQGLNYCVRQIRAVLGDEVQTPRYIETVPRRGYRFIAPVEGQEQTLPPAAEPDETPGKSFPQRRWITLAAAAVAAIGIVAGFYALSTRSAPPLTSKDTIVVADFVNSSGDPTFDDVLKQALTIELEQSTFLNILSNERVVATEKRMNRSPGRLTNELAREVCIRSNSKAMLSGSIASVGGHYLLGVSATNCQSGDTLASAEAEAENRDRVLTALEKIGNQLRQKLGESLASVNRFNKPLPEATTSSLEALRAYALASPVDQPESLTGLQRAVQLDPKFAVAYASLGVRYINFNEPQLASENFRKAFELRERVTERERYFIESAYYGIATGDLEQANKVYGQWLEIYPRDAALVYDNLSFNYGTMGQYEKCVEIMRKSLQTDTDAAIGIGNLAGCHLALGQLNEARTLADQAVQRAPDASDLRSVQYYLAFLEDDAAGMKAQMEWAGGKPGVEDIFLSAESDTAAYHGRLSEASLLSGQAVKSAQRSGAAETAAGWMVDDALRRAEFGDAAGARRTAAAALALNSGLGVRIEAALAWARSGETEKARQLADALDREFPLNTMIQSYWLPTIRAAIEIDHGSPQRAIGILQSAVPYDLAETTQFGFGTMYPAYIRGLAYLKAGQGEDAAREFQKMVDHRSVVVNFPLGSLAQLQLARAKAMSHDVPGARAACGNFLRTWKDADRDIPVLKRAQKVCAEM